MNKKALGLCLSSVALLASCAKKGIKINPDKEKYVVGICQLVQHVALDAATNGFKSKLEEKLAAEGRKVEFDYQNASGEMPLCASIVNGFVARDVDMIMANATSALQAAYNATEVIPVVATSITDYGAATGLEMKDGKSGTNVSGTSDLASISQQIDIMLDLLPSTVQTVGILYCSAEANSKFQVNEAKKALQAKGITVREHSFAETTEIDAACQACLADDAIYVPTDNTVANNVNLVKANLTDKGKPVFAGEAGICKGAGFATLSIDYYRLGEITGEMAANILLGKKDIRTYEIQYDTAPTKMYNAEVCSQLGITVPADFVEIQ